MSNQRTNFYKGLIVLLLLMGHVTCVLGNGADPSLGSFNLNGFCSIAWIGCLVLLVLFVVYYSRFKYIEGHTNFLIGRQKTEIQNLMGELARSNAELLASKKLVEASDERLRLMIKNSNDIFVLLNEKGEQVFVSDAAWALTGYTVEELYGLAEDVVLEEDRDIVRRHLQRVMSNRGVSDVIRYRHKHKTKGSVWFEAVAQNHLDNPDIRAVVCNVRDITERRNAELALQESEAAQASLLKYEMERIADELELNLKSMTSHTLKRLQNAQRDAQANDLLLEVQSECSSETKLKIMALVSENKRLSSQSNWSEFELLFEKVHRSFYEKLNAHYPDLTPNERRICAFLKLNMSNKDIAQITFQSEDALKKARLRLRQKLAIDRETNLSAFLQSI
jgi:PAS domain S-box-containing protein